MQVFLTNFLGQNLVLSVKNIQAYVQYVRLGYIYLLPLLILNYSATFSYFFIVVNSIDDISIS